MRQFFLPTDAAELKPYLLAIAEVRYLSRSPSVDISRVISALVDNPRETGQKWEDFVSDLDEKGHSGQSTCQSEFRNPARLYGEIQLVVHAGKRIRALGFSRPTRSACAASKALGISAGPEVSDVDFLKQAHAAAAEKAQAEIKKLESSSKNKQTTLKGRVERAQAKVDKLEKEATSRNIDTALKVGETLLKFASKKKLTGVSSSATKFRMSSDAKGRLEEAKNRVGRPAGPIKRTAANPGGREAGYSG